MIEHLYLEVLSVLHNKGIAVDINIAPTTHKYFRSGTIQDMSDWSLSLNEIISVLRTLKGNDHIYFVENKTNSLTNFMSTNGTFLVSLTPNGFVFYSKIEESKTSKRNFRTQITISVVTIVIAGCGAYMTYLNYQLTKINNKQGVNLEKQIKSLEKQFQDSLQSHIRLEAIKLDQSAQGQVRPPSSSNNGSTASFKNKNGSPMKAKWNIIFYLF